MTHKRCAPVQCLSPLYDGSTASYAGARRSARVARAHNYRRRQALDVAQCQHRLPLAVRRHRGRFVTDTCRAAIHRTGPLQRHHKRTGRQDGTDSHLIYQDRYVPYYSMNSTCTVQCIERTS